MPLQHPMVHGAMMLPAPTGMSNALAETLTISNYIFTGLFTMEMILKLFALGFFEACQYRLLWQVYTFVSLMPSLSACVLLLHALCTGMQMVYVSPR